MHKHVSLPAVVGIALAVAGCGGSSGGDNGPPDDGDPPPPPSDVTISIADAAAPEGDAGTSSLTFTLSLSAALASDAGISYSTADGSASAGTDYTAASDTLTIPAGVTTTNLSVSVIGDPDDEVDESFTVTLSAPPSGVTIDRAQATGVIEDDDPAPTLAVSGASVTEGDGAAVFVNFDISLSALAQGDVIFDYATVDDSAVAGQDYVAAAGSATIAGGDRSIVVDVELIGDDVEEGDESFELVISNVSTTATLQIDRAAGVILDDDEDVVVATSPWRLNDTGVTGCSDGSSAGLACGDTGSGTDQYPGQDGEQGRDNTADDDSDGVAGFVFTKLDQAGTPLADQSSDYLATPWDCVRDEITGLVWEVKTTDGGLRDSAWTYSWYNSSGIGDAGAPGLRNGGECSGGRDCDTQGYALAVNAAGLCGFSDWRLPNRHELVSLMHLGATAEPLIDKSFFANHADYPYWSETTTSPGQAGYVSYSRFATGSTSRTYAHAVRLVRGGE